jgi:hypothetical protein
MTQEEREKMLLDLELRKVKALEKIGNSIDALSIWFEEIDKEDWSARIQYYLAEFWAIASPAKKLPTGKTVKMDDEDETEEA